MDGPPSLAKIEPADDALALADALGSALEDYLEALELAEAVLGAGDEEEISALRGGASQLGVSAIALARSCALNDQGDPVQVELLREVGESLILLAVAASAEEASSPLLLSQERARAELARLGPA